MTFVLLDCPPNLGVITVNAIYTADRILIPTTYGRYSLDGIADLFASIEEIRENEGEVCWILRNAFDSRNRATNEYIEAQLESVRQRVLTDGDPQERGDQPSADQRRTCSDF